MAANVSKKSKTPKNLAAKKAIAPLRRKASSNKPSAKETAMRVGPVVTPAPAETAPPPKSTKQECVLNLLSRSGGASLDEMMAATAWQLHSVRGFLAGTVKKKLGFELTSTKDKGKPRRYRIDKRPAR